MITRRPLVPVLSINPATSADDYYTERKMWTLTGDLVMPRKPSPSPPPSPTRPKAKETKKERDKEREHRKRQRNGKNAGLENRANGAMCSTRDGKEREDLGGKKE